MRVGIGFDVHQLCKGENLIIGGVNIPYSSGLKGHSDADVLTHALMDAILGAAGKGDIGELFPDTDVAYKDINSLTLLKKVYNIICDSYQINNIDMVIMAEEPKMAPFKEDMISNYAETLHIKSDSINIKATTTEKLGFVGRSEGIAAQAVVSIIEI